LLPTRESFNPARAHRRQPERLVKLSVRQQPGVGRDLAAQERQLHAAVEIDPQITFLAVTHGVHLSLWHVEPENPVFSAAQRKSRAKTKWSIWEMRA
jgi:hypothetical protein